VRIPSGPDSSAIIKGRI